MIGIGQLVQGLDRKRKEELREVMKQLQEQRRLHHKVGQMKGEEMRELHNTGDTKCTLGLLEFI